jgi:photosystem II stability/assembly factor-like uncharacterized protein
VVPDAENLQFRDVEAVSSRIAYLLSVGDNAGDFRIYHTRDGGATWSIQFQNTIPNGFYDCFDFWNPNHGLTFADAVPIPPENKVRFTAIETRNGRTWQDISDRLPTPQAGEAGFAASGTCVKTLDGRLGWIGTGGGEKARIFTTTDEGKTWAAHLAPDGLTQGTGTSGVVSIDFRDRLHGILGGGDVGANDTEQKNVARSNDGGNSWTLATSTPFKGAVFGITYVPGGQKTAVVATGPGGTAWSPDEGTAWSDPLKQPNSSDPITNCWTVAFATRKAGWLGCKDGKIFKLSFKGD